MIPLHRLPKRALDIVLRNMTTMNQFLLSLDYDHLKSRIKSLNVGIDLSFKILVTEEFEMYITGPNGEWLDFTFCNNDNGSVSRREKQSFTENDIVRIIYIDDDWDYGWKFEEQKSARQWILLIMEVFNLKKITSLMYLADEYCFDSVKGLLKGIQLERLVIIGDEVASKYQNILNTVPSSLLFVLETDPGKSVRNVLLQNFESIDLAFPLNFPDLLITNSRFLSVSGRKLTTKNLNRFLKLWRKGSNSNAKHFSIRQVPIPDNEEVMNVLKGIPYDSIPNTVERSFLRCPFSLPVKYEKIRGGYDIKRMTDGQKATVKLNMGRGSFSFEFFVWDD